LDSLVFVAAIMGDRMKTSEIWFPNSHSEVFNAVMQVAPSLGGATVVYSDPVNGSVNLSVGMSFWSWGENVTVKVTETAPRQTWLQVVSSSKFGLDAAGRNKRNVDTLMSWVSQALTAGPQANAAQPQQQQEPQPHTPPPSRSEACAACNAPLQPDAKFCTKCGAPVA
jgi:hypothetical protein